MIQQFQEEYRWLSNFAPVTIKVQDIEYPSVEHYYQAMKTKSQKTRLKIASLPEPAMAKKYGSKVRLRDDWEDIKVKTMYHGLKLKFYQEPYRTLLLDTDDEELQEGNYWNDKFWGVCLKTGHGKNVLGRLIMKIRDQLVKLTSNTETIKLTSIKDTEEFNRICHLLNIDDDLADRYFQHGEYANIELEVDAKLNIVSGKFLPFKSN